MVEGARTDLALVVAEVSSAQRDRYVSPDSWVLSTTCYLFPTSSAETPLRLPLFSLDLVSGSVLSCICACSSVSHLRFGFSCCFFSRYLSVE